MSYRVLRDYGSYEGMKFDDGEFATVGAAVKAAIADPCTRFLIIQVIDWEAAAVVKPSSGIPTDATAERTRLAVQAIPFALPEKRTHG